MLKHRERNIKMFEAYCVGDMPHVIGKRYKISRAQASFIISSLKLFLGLHKMNHIQIVKNFKLHDTWVKRLKNEL